MRKTAALIFLLSAFCFGGTERMLLGELVFPNGETNSCVVYVISGSQRSDALFFQVSYQKNGKVLNMAFKDAGSTEDAIIAADVSGKKTLIGSVKDERFQGTVTGLEKEVPAEKEKEEVPEFKRRDLSQLHMLSYKGKIGTDDLTVNLTVSGEERDRINLVLLRGSKDILVRRFSGRIIRGEFEAAEAGAPEKTLKGIISGKKLTATLDGEEIICER